MESILVLVVHALSHKSIDTTAERHFAEIIRDHIIAEIEIVEKEMQTSVKAVTNAAHDCHKAWALVVKDPEDPEVIPVITRLYAGLGG